MDRTYQAQHANGEMNESIGEDLPINGRRKKDQWLFRTRVGAQLMAPLSSIRRILIKQYSLWVSKTYPFASVGSNLSIHFRADLSRTHAHRIQLGSSVVIDKDSVLRVQAPLEEDGDPILIVEDGSVVGPRCFMSAKNRIWIDRDVVLESSVLIQDHSHAYKDVNVTIRQQGVTEGGKVRINQGCWIGQGTVIHCDQGELNLGPNCVVAPNSLVNRSFPGYSLIAGNPARVVKQYDIEKGVWVLGSSRPTESEATMKQSMLA
jgi:acetyltransferase-like isoleucine patch superfamily enzyme